MSFLDEFTAFVLDDVSFFSSVFFFFHFFPAIDYAFPLPSLLPIILENPLYLSLISPPFFPSHPSFTSPFHLFSLSPVFIPRPIFRCFVHDLVVSIVSECKVCLSVCVSYVNLECSLFFYEICKSSNQIGSLVTKGR